MKKNKFFRVLFIVISVIIIIFIYLLFVKDNKKKNIIYYDKFKEEDVKIILSSTGILDSMSSINIVAPLVRRFQRKLVYLIKEGTLVRRGTILARFDTSDMYERLETYRLKRGGFRGKLKDTKISFNINVDDLKAKLDTAKENEKVNQLTYDGMSYASELEKQKALIKLNQAKAQVKISQNRIKQENNRMNINLHQIEMQIKDVEQNMKNISNYISKFSIYSPAKGLVVYPLIRIGGNERKVQPGDTLYYGQTFLSIPNLFKMIVKIEIDEEKISKIKLGQKTEIILDSYKNKIYHGKIYKIDRLAHVKENNKYIKVFNVYSSIMEKDISIFKPGMNALTKIFVKSYKGIYTIDNKLVDENNNKYYLFKLIDNKIINTNINFVDFTDEKSLSLSADTNTRYILYDDNLKNLVISNMIDLNNVKFEKLK